MADKYILAKLSVCKMILSDNRMKTRLEKPNFHNRKLNEMLTYG